jgi:plastocyanin
MIRQVLALIAVAVPGFFYGGRTHEVEMAAFQFSPQLVAAAVGDTIVWQNRDVVPHTATASDGSWDSGPIPAKSSRKTVVRKKGKQPFECIYHSNMKGNLVVR